MLRDLKSQDRTIALARRSIGDSRRTGALRDTVSVFGLVLVVALAACPSRYGEGVIADESEQAEIYATVLRAERGTPVRRFALADEFMFDSARAPRTIAEDVRANLIRQGLVDSACTARPAAEGDACQLVRVSLPVVTAGDTVDVYVNVAGVPRVSATSVYRLARDEGSWRIVRRAAGPAATVRPGPAGSPPPRRERGR